MSAETALFVFTLVHHSTQFSKLPVVAAKMKEAFLKVNDPLCCSEYSLYLLTNILMYPVEFSFVAIPFTLLNTGYLTWFLDFSMYVSVPEHLCGITYNIFNKGGIFFMSFFIGGPRFRFRRRFIFGPRFRFRRGPFFF